MSKSAFNTRKGELFWFDPKELVLITDKEHPLYDERVNLPVNDALVRNIMFEGQGVLEPVIITKEGGSPVVVDGRQRTKAARVASDKIEAMGGKGLMVPCVYRRGTDQNLAAIMVSTNEQRRSDSPTEKAKKANMLLNFGHTMDQVADIFGCTKVTLKSYLDLLSLDDETRAKVETGEITKTQAAKASRLPRKQRRRATKRKPRVRGRAEIEAKLADAQEHGHKTFQRALAWVLKEIDELEVE
jgi:ParB family chromosome partitioning protein